MSFDTFEQAFPALKGRDISIAIDHLGIPSGKYLLDDKEVYVWSTSENYTTLTPQTTTITGNTGLAPFNAYATSSVPQTTQLSCEIKIMTHQKIIQRLEYDGNNGTCMPYAERLKPLIAAPQ